MPDDRSHLLAIVSHIEDQLIEALELTARLNDQLTRQRLFAALDELRKARTEIQAEIETRQPPIK
jgi:hypothetical protein